MIDPSFILGGEEEDELVALPEPEPVPFDEWGEVRFVAIDDEEQDDPRGFIGDDETPLYPPHRAARE